MEVLPETGCWIPRCSSQLEHEPSDLPKLVTNVGVLMWLVSEASVEPFSQFEYCLIRLNNSTDIVVSRFV